MDSDSDSEQTSAEIESHVHFHKLDRQYLQGMASSSYDSAWYAYDDTTGRECIWNTISSSRFTEAAWAKLEGRLRILTQMKHSNICRFMDYWVTEDLNSGSVNIHFMTEVMTSGNLKRYLAKKNQLAKIKVQMKVCQRWCRQILSALNHLHSNNITHGNLCLDTVYIQHNGLVKIGDLWLGDLKQRGNSYTTDEEGSNTHWAPELYDEPPEKGEDLPPKIDIYAFGLLVLEMVTGERPYKECATFSEVYSKVVQGIKPASLEKVDNANLRDMISQCLNPKDTRPSAKDLLGHGYLFEVPPLKVFAAQFILKNDWLERCQSDSRLSAEDLDFLNEVESGSWGSLANVRGIATPEHRRTADNATLYVFIEAVKSPNGVVTGWALSIVIHLCDGLRRMVTCDYDPMEDTPASIVHELIYEGLICESDRMLWTRAIEAKIRTAEFNDARGPTNGAVP